MECKECGQKYQGGDTCPFCGGEGAPPQILAMDGVFDGSWRFLKEDLGDQLGTWAGNQAENRAYNDEQDQQDIEAAGGKEAYLEQQIAQLQQVLEQKELLIQELRGWLRRYLDYILENVAPTDDNEGEFWGDGVKYDTS